MAPKVLLIRRSIQRDSFNKNRSEHIERDAFPLLTNLTSFNEFLALSCLLLAPPAAPFLCSWHSSLCSACGVIGKIFPQHFAGRAARARLFEAGRVQRRADVGGGNVNTRASLSCLIRIGIRVRGEYEEFAPGRIRRVRTGENTKISTTTCKCQSQLYRGGVPVCRFSITTQIWKIACDRDEVWFICVSVVARCSDSSAKHGSFVVVNGLGKLTGLGWKTGPDCARNGSFLVQKLLYTIPLRITRFTFAALARGLVNWAPGHPWPRDRTRARARVQNRGN
eukprot:gene7340-biopygen12043